MTSVGGGVGVLSVVVWPTHAGAINQHGEEPLSNLDYRRGQISWAVGDDGKIRGHTTIHVPAGEWDWIVYCHHPTDPIIITATKFAHPLILPRPGAIDLRDLDENDLQLFGPDSVLHN